MDVIWLKVIAFFSFILVGGGFAVLPLAFQKVESKSRQIVITLAECFAGGVFLATGWVHLLPESTEKLQNVGTGVPLANMLSVCGFLIVFLIEKVFFLSNGEEEFKFEDEHSHEHAPPRKSSTSSLPVSQPKSDKNTAPASPSAQNMAESEIEMLPVTPASKDECCDDPPLRHSSIQDTSVDIPSTRQPSSDHGGHDHGLQHLINSPREQSAIAKLLPYVLMIVLSVHSIIAGITLGVAQTTPDMAPLFIAIISHKWTESFALGVSLLKLGEIKKFVRCVAMYTSMVPVGIILGSLLSLLLTGRTADVTAAILNGIASGTFIYIALVDILLEQFQDAKYKFYKYMSLIFGFLLITGLFLLFDEEKTKSE